MKLLRLIAFLWAVFLCPAYAQWQVPNHSVPIGIPVGTGFHHAGPCASNVPIVGGASGTQSDPICADAVNLNTTSTTYSLQAVNTWTGAPQPNNAYGLYGMLRYRPTGDDSSNSAGMYAILHLDSPHTFSGSPAAVKGNAYIMPQITAAIASGGSGNAVGDVLTISGGTCTNDLNTVPQFTVDAVTNGAVTAASFVRGTTAACSVYPSNPVTTTSSNGLATPPQLNLTIATTPTVSDFVAGLYGRVRNQSAGTIAKAIALFADGAYNTGGGTITEADGIWVEAPYDAPTRSYGIHFNNSFPDGTIYSNAAISIKTSSGSITSTVGGTDTISLTTAGGSATLNASGVWSAPKLNTANSEIQFNGTTAFASGGNYNQLYDPVGTATVFLGNTTDPTNYFNNTKHEFRSRSGTPFLDITSAGLSMWSTSGLLNINRSASITTYNFNLPDSAGTSGYFLTSAGGGSSPMTWMNPTGVTVAGDVTGTLGATTVAKVNGNTPGGACAANNWVSSISSSAVPTCTQPSVGNLTSGALANGTTATTQAANSNDTKVATNAYVDRAVPQGAWTSYTPSLTCGTGSLTSATATGAYQQTGKSVEVRIKVAVTTNGTCAGQVRATLPVNVIDTQSGAGTNGNNQKSLNVQIGGGANSNTAYITFYDGTYPGADGVTLYVNGVYEAF